MQDIVMILGHLHFHWNMTSEADEWSPIIERCLSRTKDSEILHHLEDANHLRKQMRQNKLYPAAIALLILQLEDLDPVRRAVIIYAHSGIHGRLCIPAHWRMCGALPFGR